MIFFCWASLEKSIYVMDGLGGFTSQVGNFVEAKTSDDASDAYRQHLEKEGIRVRTVTAKVAAKQDKSKYLAPEGILPAMKDDSADALTLSKVKVSDHTGRAVPLPLE